MIPKIIHQTWFNKNKLPTIFEKLRNESIKNNNDFEFILWDDNNIDIFLEKNYNKIYNIYKKNILGVQKSDLARLAIVHYYGGIYIDLDILLLKNLNSLFNFNLDTFYISYEPSEQTKHIWNADNYICNAFFACNSKNEIIQNIIDIIISIYDKYGDDIFGKFNIFGSDLYKLVIDKSNKSLYTIIETNKIFPISDIKLELDSCDNDFDKIRYGNYDSDSYMVHYWIHSNFEAVNIIYNFNYNDKETIHENLGKFFENMYPNNKTILNNKKYILRFD